MMTTIIGRNIDGRLELSGDKRVIFNNGKYKDYANKIIKLDNILLGKAGDAIDIKLIEELYNGYIRHNPNIKKNKISTITDVIELVNYIKDNCNIKIEGGVSTSFIIMHEDFQIIVETTGQVTNIKDTGGVLSIGSGSSMVDSIIRTYDFLDQKINLFEIYKLVSDMDPYTSSKFDVLYL